MTSATIAVLEARIVEYQEAIDANRRQLTSELEERQNLSTSRESLLSRIERKTRHIGHLSSAKNSLRPGSIQAKRKLNSLKGSTPPSKAMKPGVQGPVDRQKPDIVGIVANLITVADEETVGLIERFLGTSIQTHVVFKTDASSRRAMGY